MSGSEMKLDIAYTMLGLHGQIEITNGSIRPITSATFPRRVFVAIAARAKTLQQQEEEASDFTHTQKNTSKCVTPNNIYYNSN